MEGGYQTPPAPEHKLNLQSCVICVYLYLRLI